MKALIAAALALALAGCAYTGQIVTKAPVATIASSLPPDAYVRCEMPKVFAAGWRTSTTTPYADSTLISISASVFGDANAVLQVRDDGRGGSVIGVHRGPMSGLILDTIMDVARACSA